MRWEPVTHGIVPLLVCDDSAVAFGFDNPVPDCRCRAITSPSTSHPHPTLIPYKQYTFDHYTIIRLPRLPWPSVISRRNGRFPQPAPPPCPEFAMHPLWSVWSPLVSFKFGLEGLPPYPVWAAHFLWSVSGPKGPPHLQPAMHPLWLVPGWVGRSSSDPHPSAPAYTRRTQITTYPKPQKYQARNATARNDVPKRRRKGPGPPASCRRIGFRLPALSTPKVPAPKLTGCSTHAPWHSRRIPERPTNGGHWPYGQNTPHHSGCGHKLPRFR